MARSESCWKHDPWKTKIRKEDKEHKARKKSSQSVINCSSSFLVSFVPACGITYLLNFCLSCKLYAGTLAKRYSGIICLLKFCRQPLFVRLAFSAIQKSLFETPPPQIGAQGRVKPVYLYSRKIELSIMISRPLRKMRKQHFCFWFRYLHLERLLLDCRIGIGFGFGFGFTTSFGWLVYLLWFWFYDSQVKTALSHWCCILKKNQQLNKTKQQKWVENFFISIYSFQI